MPLLRSLFHDELCSVTFSMLSSFHILSWTHSFSLNLLYFILFIFLAMYCQLMALKKLLIIFNSNEISNFKFFNRIISCLAKRCSYPLYVLQFLSYPFLSYPDDLRVKFSILMAIIHK